MAGRLTSWLTRPGLVRTLFAQLRLATRLVREPRVSVLAKAVPLLALAYIISPIDVVPDFLPIVGQLDDLALMLIALELFLRFCPKDVVSHHRDAIGQARRYSPLGSAGEIIDAEWRRED